MKILAIEKELEGLAADDFAPHLETEALHVYELYKEGILREIYFRSDQNSAVLVLECESTKQADEILSGLPLVKNKLIEFEIIPLIPYPGFDRIIR